MPATSGFHANFDSRRGGAARKLRLALARLRSRRAFRELGDRPRSANGFDLRAWIWRHPDNDRWSFCPLRSDYDSALARPTRIHGVGARRADVPIVREGPAACARQTFRTSSRTARRLRASVADWNVHSPALPESAEARRRAASRRRSVAQVCACPFWKGLLDDDLALEAGLSRCGGPGRKRSLRCHGESAHGAPGAGAGRAVWGLARARARSAKAACADRLCACSGQTRTLISNRRAMSIAAPAGSGKVGWTPVAREIRSDEYAKY